MAKSIIPVEYKESQILVDSRIIAAEMEVDHGNWLKNIVQKYQKEIEENFGVFRFKNGKPTLKGGRPEKYCMLTEDQAYYVLALSRNSKKVVELKAKLVRSFSQCRKQLQIVQLEIEQNQSQSEWQENRQQLKDSNAMLRDAIAAYVIRHQNELSENRKKWIYNNINDKLAIAVTGVNVAKFKRTRYTNCFRDALSKDELRRLENLEMLATRLIDNDVSPFEAIKNAKERLMLV
jgi:phage regulator Rha-like protein